MPVDIPHCPILRPSLAEFKNFRAFVEKTEKEYSKEYGMVKVLLCIFIDNPSSIMEVKIRSLSADSLKSEDNLT
jgi:hypothetical protein